MRLWLKIRPWMYASGIWMTELRKSAALATAAADVSQPCPLAIIVDAGGDKIEMRLGLLVATKEESVLQNLFDRIQERRSTCAESITLLLPHSFPINQ
jgi:hypothetical protein